MQNLWAPPWTVCNGQANGTVGAYCSREAREAPSEQHRYSAHLSPRCAKLLPQERGEHCCTQPSDWDQDMAARAGRGSPVTKLGGWHCGMWASCLPVHTHVTGAYSHFLQIPVSDRTDGLHAIPCTTAARQKKKKKPQIRDTMLKMVQQENWNEDLVKYKER